MIRLLFVVLLSTFGLAACVHEPPETQVSEVYERNGKLPWPEDAVVIDVRKRLDYELGHWPKAYNLPAHEAKLVDRDLKRRLALLGVHPRFTLVLVGEEKPQALAKQLKEIDLENIKTFSIRDLKLPLTREVPPAPTPKPVW